ARIEGVGGERITSRLGDAVPSRCEWRALLHHPCEFRARQRTGEQYLDPVLASPDEKPRGVGFGRCAREAAHPTGPVLGGECDEMVSEALGVRDAAIGSAEAFETPLPDLRSQTLLLLPRLQGSVISTNLADVHVFTVRGARR